MAGVEPGLEERHYVTVTKRVAGSSLTDTAKTAQDSPAAVKKSVSDNAKPSFVVMHIDQRLSVSPPEPVNAAQALRIVERSAARRGRCAKCVSHLFVDKTDGKWRVCFVDVVLPDD